MHICDAVGVKHSAKDDGMKIVNALRAPVEQRLDEIKKDNVAGQQPVILQCMSSLPSNVMLALSCVSCAIQDRPFVAILGTRISSEDLQLDSNYAMLKSYIVHMLRGVMLPVQDQLVSCKQHRVIVSASNGCACTALSCSLP